VKFRRFPEILFTFAEKAKLALLTLVGGHSITLTTTGTTNVTLPTTGTLLADTNGLSALTSAEVDQLENIGTSTISSAQWGYLGVMDQGVATSSSPSFAGVAIGATAPEESTKLTIKGGSDGAATNLLKLRSNFTTIGTETGIKLSNTTNSTGNAGSAEIVAKRTNEGAVGDTEIILRAAKSTTLRTLATFKGCDDSVTFPGNVSAGNLSLGGALTTSGAYALTLTTTGATNITLPTTGTLATTDATNPIRTRVVEIGDWNMDTATSKSVTHGLDVTKIIGVSGVIRNDTDSNRYALTPGMYVKVTSNHLQAWITSIVSTVIYLEHAGEQYNNTNFDSTSYNRGWLVIQYLD
jgi:hypothetical protein